MGGPATDERARLHARRGRCLLCALCVRPPPPHTAAASCCRLGYWVACYPLDIIKSAIQTDAADPAQRRYRGGVLATGRQLFAEGGAKRFTAGLAPCLARSFPANAVGFAVYESSMKLLQ